MLKEDIPIVRFEIPYMDKKIESLFLRAKRINAALVVMVHGYNRHGAWEVLHPFAYDLWNRGYSILLPSQIGFGG